jgi:hypothetical protein
MRKPKALHALVLMVSAVTHGMVTDEQTVIRREPIFGWLNEYIGDWTLVEIPGSRIGCREEGCLPAEISFDFASCEA